MSKIYIASKTVVNLWPIGQREHLYLVYDPDGDPTNGNEEIIRGGPEGLTFSGFGKIEVEAGFDIDISEDLFPTGASPSDRNYTELDLGMLSASTVWAAMKTSAESLGTYNSEDDLYHMNVDYLPLGMNSNSVITTILYRVGFDIADNTPQWIGWGAPIPLSTFTGANTYLGTAGNDAWDLSLRYPKIVVDQGGDDTYTIDMATHTPGKGVLTIIEKPESGSNNQLVLDGIDPGDVHIFKSSDGKGLYVVANGKLVSWIADQYDVSGQPLLKNIKVIPLVGSPVVIPVDDPNDVPAGLPITLPNWIPTISDSFHNGENAYVTPIVFDIDMSGTIELAALNGAGSVYWDIDNDGFREASGWIADGDGLLCAPGENGIVDNHAELFGNNGIYANGYLMLDAL